MSRKAEAARRNGRKGGRPRRDGSPPKPTKTHVPIETHAPLENPAGLTPKELLFVAAYCGAARFNASAAYRLAGYSTKSPAAVRKSASQLLAKPDVATLIQMKLAQRVERLGAMDGDEALENISRFARGDIRKVLAADDPIAQLPDEVACLIKAVTPSRYGRRIELYDALRANELVAKAAGKLREVHDVRVTRTLEDILAEANDLERQGAPA
jgi:hypothetical protein